MTGVGPAQISHLSLAELERLARQRNGSGSLGLREWVALAEAWRIEQALRDARGNRSAAARALGIGRRTLYSKMERMALPRRAPASRPAGDAERDTELSLESI